MVLECFETTNDALNLVEVTWGVLPISNQPKREHIHLMEKTIVMSSLPLHITPGVGCGGVVLLSEPIPTEKLLKEPELKALRDMENSANEIGDKSS